MCVFGFVEEWETRHLIANHQNSDILWQSDRLGWELEPHFVATQQLSVSSRDIINSDRQKTHTSGKQPHNNI